MVETAHKRHAYHLNRLARRDTTETTTQCTTGLFGFQNCVTMTITHKTTSTSRPPAPPQSTPASSTLRSSTQPAMSIPQPDNTPSSSSKSSRAAVPSSTSQANNTPKSSSAQPSSTPANFGASSTSLILSESSPTVFGNTALPLSEATNSFSSESSASASSSIVPTEDNGASNPHTSAIVGGIVAGIAGLAVLTLIGMYVLRRWKSRRDDQDVDELYASQFRRRSAILVEDEFAGDSSAGIAGMISAGGYKPRPPTMIERHLANGAGVGAMNYNHDDYGQHPTFPPTGGLQHFHDQSPTDQYYDTGAPGTFSVGDYATMDRGTGVTQLQVAQYGAISEQIHDGQPRHQGNYDQGAYYQHPPSTEQWNNGSPFDDGVQAPQSVYQGGGAAPASMPYDFPMTPNTRPSPDEVAQYNQVRAQSPPSHSNRREPTAYNVMTRSSPHGQNSAGNGY